MPKVRPNIRTKRKTYIREWRKYRGYTLAQIAERLEVTEGTLSHLELGKVGYTQPMLEALADVLGCQPVDLLIRNPLDPESPYTIWESLNPAQRKQAIAVLEALKGNPT